MQLDPAHDTLLNDAQQAAIQRAVTQVLGAPCQLEVRVAPVANETPAARRDRLARERQQAAEQIMQSDPTVQALLKDFGGRLETVVPAEEPSSNPGLN